MVGREQGGAVSVFDIHVVESAPRTARASDTACAWTYGPVEKIVSGVLVVGTSATAVKSVMLHELIDEPAYDVDAAATGEHRHFALSNVMRDSTRESTSRNAKRVPRTAWKTWLPGPMTRIVVPLRAATGSEVGGTPKLPRLVALHDGASVKEDMRARVAPFINQTIREKEKELS